MRPFGFSGVDHVSLMLVERGSATSAFTNLTTPGPEIIPLKHYTLPKQINRKQNLHLEEKGFIGKHRFE